MMVPPICSPGLSLNHSVLRLFLFLFLRFPCDFTLNCARSSSNSNYVLDYFGFIRDTEIGCSSLIMNFWNWGFPFALFDASKFHVGVSEFFF